jgi:hypothetical protein
MSRAAGLRLLTAAACGTLDGVRAAKTHRG